MSKHVERKNGFSLTAALATVAVVSIVAMGVASLVVQITKSQQQAFTVYNLDSARRNLSTYLTSASSWAATVAGNPALACLNPTTPGTCLNGNQPLKVFGPGGQLIFDPAIHGFDRAGTICDRGASCLIQLPLTAQVVCPEDPVTHVVPPTCAVLSELRLTGLFDISQTGENIAFNPNNYQINILAFAGAAAAAGPGTECVRPLQFTEQLFNGTPAPSVSVADAQCKSEFGSNWTVATQPDLASEGMSTSFGVVNFLYRQVSPSSPSTYMMIASAPMASMQVACICRTLRP